MRTVRWLLQAIRWLVSIVAYIAGLSFMAACLCLWDQKCPGRPDMVPPCYGFTGYGDAWYATSFVVTALAVVAGAVLLVGWLVRAGIRLLLRHPA